MKTYPRLARAIARSFTSVDEDWAATDLAAYAQARNRSAWDRYRQVLRIAITDRHRIK
jgi:hypothetical protein